MMEWYIYSIDGRGHLMDKSNRCSRTLREGDQLMGEVDICSRIICRTNQWVVGKCSRWIREENLMVRID